MGKSYNYDPITVEQLAGDAHMTVGEVLRWLGKEFGGYEGYVKACKDQDALDRKLDEMEEEGRC